MWAARCRKSWLLLLVSGVAAMSLPGCGPQSSPDSSALGGSPSGEVSVAESNAGTPSVRDVMATAQKSLRAGGVLHQTVSVTQDAGDFTWQLDRDLWLDGTRDAVRESRRFEPDGHGMSTRRDQLIAADGVLWSNGKMLERAQTCYGGGVAVSALLGCPSLTDDESTIIVRRGTWDGKPALVLVFHRVAAAEDTTETVDGREFLDATTALPLAQEEKGSITGDRTAAVHRTTIFAGGFVDVSSIGTDFFDPASLGWHAADPEQDLPTDVPVYWLGRTFDPGGGLPALRFVGVEKPRAGGPPVYAAILTYSAADDPAGPAALTIQVWTQSALDASHILWGRCASQNFSDGPLQITIRCPNVEAGHAEVRTGESFLLIDAPGFVPGSKITHSPYDTAEALLTAARALTLWQ
jgi:hypothetical protein